MKRFLTAHLPVALAYGLFVAAVGGAWWPLSVGEVVRWVGWILGVAVGVVLLFLDRVAYTYAYPSEQLSQQFTWLVKDKKLGRALELLDSRRGEQKRLTFRSALFIAIWVPLSFFALTSTTSLFGKGVVMGLMLHILYDSWRLQKLDPGALSERLFWQIKREVGGQEKMLFLYIITAVFVAFSFWVS